MLGAILALPHRDLNLDPSTPVIEDLHLKHICQQNPLFNSIFFRQLMLKDFGNLGVMKLTPPVSIKDLAMLGECCNSCHLVSP
jgi:hypothetical protein